MAIALGDAQSLLPWRCGMHVAELALELEARGEIALPGDELRDLVALLIEQGATREEIRAAGAGSRLGGLALDLALRQGPESFDFAAAASRAGLEHAEAERPVRHDGNCVSDSSIWSATPRCP